MVIARIAGQDPAMTSEQPEGATSATQPAGRPLRRRATDRVIGGVAAGIADYLNVDPLLIRALFVGLVIFGGAGLVLYVGAWLLIPVEASDDSIVDSALRRLGLVPRGLLTTLAVIGIVLFIGFVVLPSGGYYGGPAGLYVDPTLLLLALLVIVGIALLRRGGSQSAAVAAHGPETAASAIIQRTVVVREPRPRIPRGPLGWYAVAAALIGIGLFAIIDNASDVTVMPGQFFGLVLAIIGIGLVIGSWWGNARLLILPAILVLPIAWAASYLTVPLEGGTGEQQFAPVTTQELADEYRMVGGRLTLDLRELDAGNEPIRISASIAVGTLTVFLPTEAQVEIDSHVGAGGSNILGSGQNGTDVTERYVRGESGPHFVLDLGAGIGYIWVEEYR